MHTSIFLEAKGDLFGHPTTITLWRSTGGYAVMADIDIHDAMVTDAIWQLIVRIESETGVQPGIESGFAHGQVGDAVAEFLAVLELSAGALTITRIATAQDCAEASVLGRVAPTIAHYAIAA